MILHDFTLQHVEVYSRVGGIHMSNAIAKSTIVFEAWRSPIGGPFPKSHALPLGYGQSLLESPPPSPLLRPPWMTHCYKF